MEHDRMHSIPFNQTPFFSFTLYSGVQDHTYFFFHSIFKKYPNNRLITLFQSFTISISYLITTTPQKRESTIYFKAKLIELFNKPLSSKAISHTLPLQ